MFKKESYLSLAHSERTEEKREMTGAQYMLQDYHFPWKDSGVREGAIPFMSRS